MPSYRRPRIPGASIFVTVRLADRGCDLLARHVAVLREAVRAAKAERPFGIDAFVVLPDHFHAVWTLPDGEAESSVRVGAIKARFSMAMHRAGFTPQSAVGTKIGGMNPAPRRKGEVGLWQPRFWEHHIRDETARTNAIRYCWNNPVKHGLTDDPFGWPHSSIHRDMRATLAQGAAIRDRHCPDGQSSRIPATPALSPAAPLR